MLLAAAICDFDQVAVGKRFGFAQDWRGNCRLFMAGEKTDHLPGSRPLTAEDHAERSQHVRLGIRDQPKQNIAKDIDLTLTKLARAGEKQVRDLLQHLHATPGRSAPDGAVKFDNELGGSNGSHGMGEARNGRAAGKLSRSLKFAPKALMARKNTGAELDGFFERIGMPVRVKKVY